MWSPTQALTTARCARTTLTKLGEVSKRLGFTVETLSESSIPEAQRFLHSVYHHEQGWIPEHGNASNVRYDNGRLRDDFEYKGMYVGARDVQTNELVGVSRMIPQELELGRYRTNFEVSSEIKVCEINRHAVHKDWRKRGPIHFLVSHMVLTAKIQWGTELVVGALGKEHAETFADRFHAYHLSEASVVYEKGDQERSVVVMADSIPYRLGVLDTAMSLERAVEEANLAA